MVLGIEVTHLSIPVALFQVELPPPQKLLLISLWYFAQVGQEPTYVDLSEVTGLNRRTVTKHMSVLLEHKDVAAVLDVQKYTPCAKMHKRKVEPKKSDVCDNMFNDNSLNIKPVNNRSIFKPAKIHGLDPKQWCSLWNDNKPAGAVGTRALTAKHWERLGVIAQELDAQDVDPVEGLRSACERPLSDFHREWGRVSLRWLCEKQGAFLSFLEGEKSERVRPSSGAERLRADARRNGRLR